jgi:alpha-L-arabinofuranosidase
LDAVAAFSADRKKFILSVVNPTIQAQEFAPQISGVKLRGTGKLWLLAAPSVDADKEPDKEPVVKIIESPQTALPSKVKVPPISVSVYEFDVENG